MSGFLGGAISSLGGAADIVSGIGSWILSLRKASFRGATFHFDSITAASGRRAAQHEYPLRDVPFTEDLGRKQWSITLTAYVVGPLYSLQRDLLIRACTAPGLGSLVHPTLGRMDCVCTDIQVTEERQSGGYAQFSLTFVEAGQLLEPAGSTNTTAVIEGIANTIVGLIDALFTVSFDVIGEGAYLVGAAVADVHAFVDVIGSLRFPIYGEPQAALLTAQSNLILNAPEWVSNPPLLAAGIRACTAAFGENAEAQVAYDGMMTLAYSFRAHREGYAAGLVDPIEPWPSTAGLTGGRAREAANAVAFENLVRQCALVEVAYVVPGLPLTSSQEAAIVRQHVTDAFDNAQQAVADAGARLGSSAPDDAFASLVNLENAVVQDINTRILRLPALMTYTLPRSPNALALAWRFYQDAERADELVERTDARNPAFLPRTGRVLSA